MTLAHFIYIPAVLILGIVIGWILGSRAAADAYAVQLRKITAKSGQRSESDHQRPKTKA